MKTFLYNDSFNPITVIIKKETPEIIKETDQPTLEKNCMVLFNVMIKNNLSVHSDAFIYTAGSIWRHNDPLYQEIGSKYINPIEDIKDIHEKHKDQDIINIKPYWIAKWTGDFQMNTSAEKKVGDPTLPAECYSIAEYYSRKIGRPALGRIFGNIANNTESYIFLMGGYYDKKKEDPELKITEADFRNFKDFLNIELRDPIRQILDEHRTGLEFLQKSLIDPEIPDIKH